MKRLLLVLLFALCSIAPPSLVRAQGDAAEIEFWQSVKQSKSKKEIEAYLKAYPDGKFAPLARLRLQEIKGRGTSASEKDGKVAETAPVHDCDRLAAVPSNPDSVAPVNFGKSVKDNASAAIRACKEAMQEFPNEKRFQFQLAVTYIWTDRAKQGQPLIESLASQDYRPARYYRALNFCLGRGVEKDEKRCVAQLQNLSDLGFPEAISDLGFLYSKGAGVPKNIEKAIALFKRATELGSHSAMLRLGRKYDTGDGVTKDPTEAARLFRRAAETGFPAAMSELARSYAEGRGVTKDYGEALKWFRKAAANGDGQAIDALKRFGGNSNANAQREGSSVDLGFDPKDLEKLD